MNQNAAEQGWQQLQAHIEGFLGQFLKGDPGKVEYRPQFCDSLLKGPGEHDPGDGQKMS